MSLFHAMDWPTTNQVGQRQWYWGGAQDEKKSDGQEFRFCHLTGGWSNTGATPNTIQRNRRSATKYSQDTKYWDRGAQIYRQLLSWSGRYIVCQKRSMSLVLDEQIFRPSVVLKNPTLALLACYSILRNFWNWLLCICLVYWRHFKAHNRLQLFTNLI